MADSIRYRGPDHGDQWTDDEAGIALAHRRLAIVDLSTSGHQPMLSASGRLVIAYNGEIYNHPDLRRQLDLAGSAPAWRGHSDTETLLAAVEAWGLRKLKRSTGMFATRAGWDRSESRTLWLARDRIGEKPLYYGWQGETFLFGSELKALQAHPAFNASVDRGALALLLRHNYIPARIRIWKQASTSCAAGHMADRQLGLVDRDATFPVTVTESLRRHVAERGTMQPFSGGEKPNALDRTEKLTSRTPQCVGRGWLTYRWECCCPAASTPRWSRL